MSQAGVSRRSLLLGIVATAGMAYGFRLQRECTHQVAAARNILNSLPHGKTISPIGRAFLDEARPPFNLTTLIGALEKRLGTTFDQLDEVSARHAILAAIEGDYDHSDLVEIHGWLIPRTSALLAAASFQVSLPTQSEQYDNV